MGGLGGLKMPEIKVGGTLGNLGDQLKKIAEDPKGYLGEAAEKFKRLPAEFDQARIAVMTAVAPHIIVKLFESMSSTADKITIGMGDEEKLRLTITDLVIQYKALPESSSDQCPTGISSFVMTQLAMSLPPADPYLNFVRENAPRIAQEECSKSYA